MRPPARMATTTSMAGRATAHSRLLVHHIAMVPVQEETQAEGEEEEDAVHDSERKGRLEHRACLVDVQRQVRAGVVAIITKGPERDVEAAGGEVGAILVADATELVDGGDEGTNEAEINDGDKDGRAFGRAVADQGRESPCACEDGDDEHCEDVRRR